MIWLWQLFLTPLYAEMRCGNYPVEIDSTKYHVLKSCGEPMLKETSVRIFRKVRHNSKGGRIRSETEVPVEKWYYDIGGGVIYIVTFVEDRVESVDFERKW